MSTEEGQEWEEGKVHQESRTQYTPNPTTQSPHTSARSEPSARSNTSAHTQTSASLYSIGQKTDGSSQMTGLQMIASQMADSQMKFMNQCSQMSSPKDSQMAYSQSPASQMTSSRLSTSQMRSPQMTGPQMAGSQMAGSQMAGPQMSRCSHLTHSQMVSCPQMANQQIASSQITMTPKDRMLDLDIWFQKVQIDDEFSKLDQEIAELKTLCESVKDSRQAQTGLCDDLASKSRSAEQKIAELHEQLEKSERENRRLTWQQFELEKDKAALNAEIQTLKMKQEMCKCFVPSTKSTHMHLDRKRKLKFDDVTSLISNH